MQLTVHCTCLKHLPWCMDLHGWNKGEGAMEEVFVLLAFYFSFHIPCNYSCIVIIRFNDSVVPVTKGVKN